LKLKFSAPDVLVLVFFQLCSMLVVADDAPPDLQIRYPSYLISYEIDADGRFVESRSLSQTILKEPALARAKRQSVTYSTSIQRAEVLEAYTLKAAGGRIDAPKSNYQVQENRGNNRDAPVFSDMTTLTVVFPDVAVGDTVVFSYRLTATEPMFPGHFSVSQEFSEYGAFDDVRVRFDYPASLWVQYAARQMSEVDNSERDGRKIVEWSYRNPQPARDRRTDYSVYDPDKSPGIAFSTFKNYGDIAAAYGVRARPKAAVTDRIQKLADEISVGKAAPEEIAQSIYNWVATQITYAGNCIGLGAVVPHDTDFILDNRMGDCKDHATLLEALLAAKGMKSTQVLVNAGSTYKLPRVPVVSTVNHVLNHISALDMYVDSTSSSTPFGMLPFSDQGKPVLWVDNYREGMRAPSTPPEANQQYMKTVVSIQPDGSANGRVEVQLKGSFAVDSRARFRDISKDYEVDLVKNVFQSHGFVGSGEFTKEDPRELLDTYRYSATFAIKDLIVVPGPGAFGIQPLFFSEAPISRSVAVAVKDLDNVDEVVCVGGRSTEEYVYELPKGMKILAAPDDFKFEKGMLSYSATYSLKGGVLAVTRVFDDRTRGNVCSLQQVAAFKAFAQQVRPNFRGQVVYK
jgi:transglutaminase-like putative cysteine protease